MYNPAPIHSPLGRSASPNPMAGINRSRSPVPMGMGPRPLSRAASPVPPGMVSPGFQVEKRPRSPNPMGRHTMPQPGNTHDYRDENIFPQQVSTLISAKDSQFAVSGRIPIDPAQLVLFFRSKTAVAYSLEFPIDLSYSAPPALDVLLTACKPHPSSDFTNSPGYGSQQPQALYYPPNLPLTTSLEIANYPILDAIRDSLFPTLPQGKHFTAILDRLDIIESGSRLAIQPPAHTGRKDDRAATIIINLPVRFRGGAIVVRDPQGREDIFQTTGGKGGDIDWVAIRADCSYEVQPIQNGLFVSAAYGVYVKSFGPAGSTSDTFVTPSDTFFNLLSPILNMSRGQAVAFYLKHDYTANPAEAIANTIIPQLKGGDALLFDAFKFHKLIPELHWTAGGFVWPVDQTLEYFVDNVARGGPNPLNPLKMRSPSPNPGGYGRPRGISSGGGGYAGNPLSGTGPGGGYGYGYEDDNGGDASIGPRVQASGALSFAEAKVNLLTDYNNPSPVIGKQRVDFVSNGELTKLVVNVLLVVYIP